MNNVCLIVLDSVGIGALPDASKYGDEKAATLQHILEKVDNPNLPNLEKLGLGKITALNGINPNASVIGAHGKLASETLGKDTIVGHWELMGIILDKPFATFPNGFSQEILDEFSELTGYGWIGNCAESGTEIIKRLGQEHIDSKKLILYTSADSVMQIAAHEEKVPIEELYSICEIARKICDKHMIGRVIARPFITKDNSFVRTTNRRDFSMIPPGKMVLNHLMDKDILTVGIGKIDDIFAGSGIKIKNHSKGNEQCIEETISALKNNNNAFIFTNLVDFDMLYGHRRDPMGYYNCLKDFDNSLPRIIEALDDNDLLILCADHGNDPTHKGTDHTREYSPLLVFQKTMHGDVDLNVGKTFADVGKTFADVGKTILEYYDLDIDMPGKSFLDKIK